MANTNLPWMFLDRKIRPYAIGVGAACLTITLSLLLLRNDVGEILDYPSGQVGSLGFVVGTAALASFVLLFAGWWLKSERFMQYGLLLSAGLFAARAAFLFMDVGPLKVQPWLSLCWVIASGGAWLLERYSGRRNSE